MNVLLKYQNSHLDSIGKREKKSVFTFEDEEKMASNKKSKFADINIRENKFNINKIKVLADSDSEKSPNEGDEEDYTKDEIVEENEMEYGVKKHKNSRRIKPKYKGERRFSRITLGKEIVMSKVAGAKLRWGMTME
mmetsp:Transcript_36745/g.32962  ORF Transcript_36745/g.32962 Transcript_36745/m.32962 type:complete len:136 (+) Transcript_36745:4325-4732(+)